MNAALLEKNLAERGRSLGILRVRRREDRRRRESRRSPAALPPVWTHFVSEGVIDHWAPGCFDVLNPSWLVFEQIFVWFFCDVIGLHDQLASITKLKTGSHGPGEVTSRGEGWLEFVPLLHLDQMTADTT